MDTAQAVLRGSSRSHRQKVLKASIYVSVNAEREWLGDCALSLGP